MFGELYGWSVSEVLDLTLPEVSLLQDAITERMKRTEKAMNKDSKSSSNYSKGPKKKIENVLGKYERMGLVE